jgi:hypothetical protein
MTYFNGLNFNVPTATILLIVFACLVANQAHSQGRSPWVWFFLGLLTGPMVVVIALNQMRRVKPMTLCPQCRESVTVVARICPHCQHNFTAAAAEESRRMEAYQAASDRGWWAQASRPGSDG